jgi:hypothetical protein
MKRKALIAGGIMLALLTPVAFWSVLVAINNRDVEPPSHDDLRASLEKAKSWLAANHDSILKQDNPILWWMLKRAVSIQDDKNLRSLYEEYAASHVKPFPRGAWYRLFEPGPANALDLSSLAHLPDYNLFMLYGITCDRVLALDDVVKEQKERDFCPNRHPVSPACYTHQLMGLQFALQRQCDDPGTTQAVADEIKGRIHSQLLWDPRVVDVYIQRVLLLVDSGWGDRIKPVWIRRILDSQLADGSWSDFDALIAFNASCQVGFSSSGVAVCRSAVGSFHTTAQATYLLSLLLKTGPESGHASE